MKALIIGFSDTGKTTFGNFLAKAMRTVCTDTGDLIRDALALSTGIPRERLNERTQLIRLALFSYARKQCGLAGDDALWCRRAWQLGDVVCGARSRAEFRAARLLFDIVIWVHWPGVGKSPGDELRRPDAQISVLNNGTKGDLEFLARTLARGLEG